MPKTNYLDIKPALLRWAIDRAGLSVDSLHGTRVKDASLWLDGEKKPTLRQLQHFAAAVHVPIGYLFLDQPPVEKIPIPDYRTFDDNHPVRLSPNLIDTLHEIQRRQNWMRDYLVEIGADKLPFVGSLAKYRSVEAAAEKIRTDLGLTLDWAVKCRNLDDARRFLRNTIDDAGILISMTGTVGLNTHRSLDPDEFCGFTLLDDYIPALFVNSNNTLSSQMFTMAHELAHIWSGKGGVFNQVIDSRSFHHQSELFYNKIAAEFLVPKTLFMEKWDGKQEIHLKLKRLAKDFKVSAIVVARRAYDLDLITDDQFFGFWQIEKKDWEDNKTRKKNKEGGNFYRTNRVKLGKRFSEAVISATRSGFLSYRDAFRLTGLQGGTFDKYMSLLQGGELD